MTGLFDENSFDEFGRALVFGVEDCQLMLDHSIYPVIRIERSAAMLWCDSFNVPDVAQVMCIIVPYFREFAIADQVIPDLDGDVHTALEKIVMTVRDAILQHFNELNTLILEEPHTKYRAIGRYYEE